MKNILHTLRQFVRFYLSAETKYQAHSPLVFDFIREVLEDERWFYAFDDVEVVRRKMLESDVVLEMQDYGTTAGPSDAAAVRRVPLRRLVARAAVSPRRGRLLFRLAQWQKPKTILELGGGTGVSTLYLAAGARDARLCSLEGSEACAHVARANLGILNLHRRAEVIVGPFHQTLRPALEALGTVDLFFFDGHHRQAPVLEYFQQCLPGAAPGAVFVFDDAYRSAEMTAAWRQIQQHPSVTLTIDCFDLALAFTSTDVKEKQHFRLVPALWKPWKIW